MPTFDVVSEVDRQEVRNAIDQAQREIANRFDFKNTNSTIEQNDMVITLATVSRDRLDALRTVLEEKLVKRGVSLRGVDYGDVVTRPRTRCVRWSRSRSASPRTRRRRSTS